MTDERTYQDQFEIVDFRDTIGKIIEDTNKTYGKKNKPRAEEPSMYNILAWGEKEREPWDFTTKNKELLNTSALSRFKYKINKSSSHWVTEAMDQYRKFAYSPEKKGVFFDLHEPKVVLPKKKGREQQRTEDDAQKAEEIADFDFHPKDVYLKEIPKKATDYIDKFAIKQVKTLPEARQFVEGREFDKNGELIYVPAKPKPQEVEEPAEDQEQAKEIEQEEEEEEEEEEPVHIEQIDLSNVKSRLLETRIRKAKVLDPVYEKDRLDRRKERIKRLNETTRWLPNSAFMTYFGKPPFENYGKGNVNPTVGGPFYGHYMKSHNVNPQRGVNKPEYQQVYSHAELTASKLPEARPEPPRKCKDDFRLSQHQVNELKKRSPIFSEKFGKEKQSLPVQKPDLLNSLRFASEENTPENSVEERRKSVNVGESLKNLNKAARALRKEEAKKRGVVEKKTKKPKAKKVEEEAPKAHVEIHKPETTVQRPATAGARPKREEKSQEAQYLGKKMQLETEWKNNNAADSTLSETFGTLQKGQEQDKRSTLKTAETRKPAEATIRREVSPHKEIPKSAEKTRSVKFDETQQDLKQSPHQTLEKNLQHDSQKQEKLWNKINEDLDNALNIDPMNPPKNYLFSLSHKEANPKYYKNVPAVWLNRIPHAGKKNPASDDIKKLFNYEDDS